MFFGVKTTKSSKSWLTFYLINHSKNIFLFGRLLNISQMNNISLLNITIISNSWRLCSIMESAHRCSSWALICALGRICVTFCNLEMQEFFFLLERSHSEVISHIIRVIKPSYLERSIKVLNNTQMLSVLRPAVPLFKCHFIEKFSPK